MLPMAPRSLILILFALTAHARYNLDNFQFPSKANPVPELIPGDTVNATWVSSFALNVMMLWCGNNVKVFQTDDLPFQGAFQLNVTEAWTFPCHFQMGKQDDFGWFDSGEMDAAKEDREPRVFSADSQVVCPVANDTASTIPQITSAPTVTVTAAAGSCPVDDGTAKMGMGIGIGLGIAVLMAALVGGIVYLLRRKQNHAMVHASQETEKPPAIYAYRHPSSTPASVVPNYSYNPMESHHDQSPQPRPADALGGYLNGHAVELNHEAGPYELNSK